MKKDKQKADERKMELQKQKLEDFEKRKKQIADAKFQREKNAVQLKQTQIKNNRSLVKIVQDELNTLHGRRKDEIRDLRTRNIESIKKIRASRSR